MTLKFSAHCSVIQILLKKNKILEGEGNGAVDCLGEGSKRERKNVRLPLILSGVYRDFTLVPRTRGFYLIT